ncbi:MAG: hypothetical protein SFV22_10115 [Saprospiraceae bacterium]|nr:hypothetical protein [Saprospiraceae bacterium]
MKNYTAFLLLLLTQTIFAQNKANNRFVWGFVVSAETQSLGIQPLNTRRPENAAVQPRRPHLGGAAGFSLQKRLWRGLSFQPALSVAYNNNQVFFDQDGLRSYRFWDIELPLHLVVTDLRKRETPLRACVLFGGRIGWNLSKNPTELLHISPERYALDLGLGAEIKWGKCRFQPAIIYSHGLNNIHLLDNAKYDWQAGRMVRDRLSFRLFIQMRRNDE